MQPVPLPTLGEVTAITITSPDLEKSLQFYQKLGFNEVMRMDFPFPWIQITDGALLIMLRKDDKPYIALTWYVKDIDRSVAHIENAGLSFKEKSSSGQLIRKYVLQSPDGMNLSLVHIPDGFQQPAGPTMLNMQQTDYFNPEKYVNKVCGMFGEFAEPVKDLEQSISFYSKLGFHALHKTDAPYPWAILSDGLAVVGLHQTEKFSKPTITFFASDSKEKIERLKQAGLDTYKDQGTGNLVISTPEAQDINLFKLGM